MKNIEEIIRGSRDYFEEREPSEGHFERFRRKLEKRFQPAAVKRSIVPYLLKAAVITLLVTLSSLWTWDHFLRPGRERMALGDVSPQYREVENYYIHQVGIVENEISSSDIARNPGQSEMLKKEMKSMDSVYVQLQKELKANPDDERIINAMIVHYQTKLEVMSYIVNQLKAVRNENKKGVKHENSSL
ncbi:MAG: hypothetical protein ABSG89_05415 [Bacteroidales bacterium]|jgi:hypothetical protein